MFQLREDVGTRRAKAPMAQEKRVPLSLRDLVQGPEARQLPSRHFGNRHETSWGASRYIVTSPANTQLTHLATECVRVEIQNSGSALRSVNHPTRSVESGNDVIAFHLLET